MNLRDDLQLIYDWIPAGSRVLDLGCGDGELLHALVQHKNCKGYGVEIDTNSVIAAIARGVNVIQADLEQGLQAFGDGSFDVIVLSQTIQAMQNVETILRDLTRVAKEAIVTFPNFGYWRNRFQVAFSRQYRGYLKGVGWLWLIASSQKAGVKLLYTAFRWRKHAD